MTSICVRGTFSDGKSSQLTAASLVLEADHIVVRNDQGIELFRCIGEQIQISSRLGHTPRTIRFETANDGPSFESLDNDGIDHLLLPQRAPSTLLHRLESNLAWVAVATLCTLALMLWTVMYGLPKGANALAFSLPPTVIQQTSDSTLAVLDRTYFEPSELDDATQQRLREALEPHILNDSTSLHFRQWAPNALALADGSIVFTDALINLADNDEELIAIAYHELGHVEHRHLIRRAIQGSAIAITLFLLTGDVSDVDILVTVPATLVDLAYSRQFEVEADQFALASLSEKGIDTVHFYNIMKKLGAYYGDQAEQEDGSTLLNYLSTHPQTQERLAMIQAYGSGKRPPEASSNP